MHKAGNLLLLQTLSSLLFATLIMLPVTALAEDQLQVKQSVNDLTTLNLEELMNIDVSSLMKSSARLSDVAGAVVVITSDDIRRIGATSIPEALRLVPGMHVARIDGNKWSVSVRGFAGQFANKLLVLVDGRSVYTPLYAGVWWDQLDGMMEDIDRIEVIRGPGASLWGANAVNGVINIVTKSARATQGGLASAYAGNKRDGAGVRFGTKVGDDAFLRVFGRYARQDGSIAQDDQNGADYGHLSKLGFLFDKTLSPQDGLTLQGEVFNGYAGGANLLYPNLTAVDTPVFSAPFNVSLPTSQEFQGFNILGRWDHTLENGSSIRTKAYWDSHVRTLNALNAGGRVNSLDLDFQHNFNLAEQQKIIWGLGYRRNVGDVQNSAVIAFFPNYRIDNIYSAFIQDEFTLVPDRWKLTLGTKLEHNPVTGIEVQPNVRLLWTPNDRSSMWAAVSRAVRTPSWVDQDINVSAMIIPPFPPYNLPIVVASEGGANLKSEHLIAYELGWRGLVSPTLSADFALYYFDYNHVSTAAPGAIGLEGNSPQFFVVLPVYFSNYGNAQHYGGELSVSWQVLESWKLRANYSNFQQNTSLNNAAPGRTVLNFEGAYPRNQAMLWSQHTLSPTVKLDLNFRYVSNVGGGPQAPGAYTALDARLAWRVKDNIELALVGHNLLNKGHFESNESQFIVQTKNPREVFATLCAEF